MPPAEGSRIGNAAARGGLADRLASHQCLRLVPPALLEVQAGQRRSGQRIERLAAAGAAVARLAAGVAPAANLRRTAMRAAKALDPVAPELAKQAVINSETR